MGVEKCADAFATNSSIGIKFIFLPFLQGFILQELAIMGIISTLGLSTVNSCGCLPTFGVSAYLRMSGTDSDLGNIVNHSMGLL